jgi:hypothetical protein
MFPPVRSPIERHHDISRWALRLRPPRAAKVTTAGNDMCVWQGVAMNSLKIHPGLLCPNLLCPVGGPPLTWFYSHFRDGSLAGQTACGHFYTLLDTPRCTPMEDDTLITCAVKPFQLSPFSLFSFVGDSIGRLMDAGCSR